MSKKKCNYIQILLVQHGFAIIFYFFNKDSDHTILIYRIEANYKIAGFIAL